MSTRHSRIVPACWWRLSALPFLWPCAVSWCCAVRRSYVEFYDDPNERAFEPSAAAFHEFYDVAADPWQMNNLYPTADKGLMQQLSARLHSEYGCRGSACA